MHRVNVKATTDAVKLYEALVKMAATFAFFVVDPFAFLV